MDDERASSTLIRGSSELPMPVHPSIRCPVAIRCGDGAAARCRETSLDRKDAEEV